MAACRYDVGRGYIDAAAKARKWFDKLVLSRVEGLSMNGAIPSVAGLFPFILRAVEGR